MKNLAVSVRGLGKHFEISNSDGPRAYGYRTLRDDLMRWAEIPLRYFGKAPEKPPRREFWSLRNVNFDIQRGEVVGIIGRNGAGKSTLLKILSRITKPTEGEATLHGRVGSLLEVGTGFHPELTGRENIYLNGAILGMRRQEIERKFEPIVEFAEIGPFLDTPVKRYSSGMYVRLAFAVAAHLEPEILIVDEVLAVGDMGFQRKCLGRMREVGRSGATVLFVSHNMPAIESLCDRAILLEQGRIAHNGPVRDMIQEYHRRLLESTSAGGMNLEKFESPERLHKIFRSAALIGEDGEPSNFLPVGGRFHLRLALDAPINVDFPLFMVGIDDNMGQRLLSLQSPATNSVVDHMTGRAVLECIVDQFPLAPGDYWLKLGLFAVPDELDEIERVLRFTVTDGELFGAGRGFHRGTCVAPAKWTYQAYDQAPVVAQ